MVSSVKMKQEVIISKVRCWLESMVIALNLCPFAKGVLANDRLHFFVSEAKEVEKLLIDLQQELERLQQNSSIETSLLIHPYVLKDFEAYNQFLDLADELLESLGLVGHYQIASFHPNYQFANTNKNDVVNYTNRSPYPLLHILPELSVEQAIANYPNVDLIPQRNIALLESMGLEKVKGLYTKE